MTKTQEYLEAIRDAEGGATDYRLAKMLEIPRTAVHEMVRGTRHADAYASTRMALQLKRDPLELIAEIEAEHARSKMKREFWRSFLSGLTLTTYAGAWLLTGVSSLPGQTGGIEPASHNGRLRQRPANRKAPGGAFFSFAWASGRP